MCIEYRVMFKWIRLLRWRKLHVPQESGQRNRDHHETGLMIFMSGGMPAALRPNGAANIRPPLEISSQSSAL
jgi:hypothetical protein